MFKKILIFTVFTIISFESKIFETLFIVVLKQKIYDELI